MMRTIAFFTDSEIFGGAEQMLLTTLSNLDQTAWNPVLLHYPAPGLQPLLEGASRMNVHAVSVASMPEGRSGAEKLPAFTRELRNIRPSVFHAQLTWPMSCKYALAGAVLARVP